MSDAPNSPRLRLDLNGLLRCAGPRKRNPDVECETTISRPAGDRLEIRCRSCGELHVFVARDGRIVPLGEVVNVCLDSRTSPSLVS